MMGLVQYDGAETQVTVFPEPTSWAYVRGEDGRLLIGRGEARCRADDHFDAEIGRLLAMSRAMEHLAQQIAELADSRIVSEVDWQRRMAARRREAIATAKKRQRERKRAIEEARNESNEAEALIDQTEDALREHQRMMADPEYRRAYLRLKGSE